MKDINRKITQFSYFHIIHVYNYQADGAVHYTEFTNNHPLARSGQFFLVR